MANILTVAKPIRTLELYYPAILTVSNLMRFPNYTPLNRNAIDLAVFKSKPTLYLLKHHIISDSKRPNGSKWRSECSNSQRTREQQNKHVAIN